MAATVRLTRNLHTNPVLGTGSTAWTSVVGTFSRTNEDAPPGLATWSAKLVSTGAIGNALYAGYMTADPGLAYSASAQVKMPAGLAFRVYFQYWDASTVILNGFTVYTGTGDWQRVGGSDIAPTGTTRMRLSIYAHVAHANGTVFRMSAADYRQGSEDGTTIHGDLPGCAWEGTAHASTSIRIEGEAPQGDVVPGDLLVTISEAGGDTPRTLASNGVDLSWRINARGEASVEIRTALLRDAGLLRCRGFEIAYDHSALGPWAGVIQQTRHDGTTATTEIAAQTNEARLDARRTPQQYESSAADAGGVAGRVVADTSWDGSAFLQQEYRIGETELVDVSLRAEQVVDAIDQLAALADAEWRVTHDGYFEFMPTIGEDRSAAVSIVEDRDFGAAWEVIEDVRPLVNNLLAMSGVDRYTRKTAVVVLDEASIEEIGERQGAIVFPYGVKESFLRSAARQELARLARLGRAATIDVRNTNGLWASFREGDVISLVLPSVELDARLRVTARTWSSTTNVLTIVGEWV